MYARWTSNEVKSLLPGPGKFVCVVNCGPNPVWVYTPKSAKNTAPIRIFTFANTIESDAGCWLFGCPCCGSAGSPLVSAGCVDAGVVTAGSVESGGDSAKRGLAKSTAAAHTARMDLIRVSLDGLEIRQSCGAGVSGRERAGCGRVKSWDLTWLNCLR